MIVPTWSGSKSLCRQEVRKKGVHDDHEGDDWKKNLEDDEEWKNGESCNEWGVDEDHYSRMEFLSTAVFYPP